MGDVASWRGTDEPRTNQRGSLKMELVDPFELRKRVMIVLLLVGSGLGNFGLWVVNLGVGQPIEACLAGETQGAYCRFNMMMCHLLGPKAKQSSLRSRAGYLQLPLRMRVAMGDCATLWTERLCDSELESLSATAARAGPKGPKGPKGQRA
jgi:hypothetical protein